MPKKISKKDTRKMGKIYDFDEAMKAFKYKVELDGLELQIVQAALSQFLQSCTELADKYKLKPYQDQQKFVAKIAKFFIDGIEK
jgi:hypothetical protein